MAARLTEKQKRFVEEYLVDLNATDAARRAGYKDPNIGRQLITKNNVSAEIQKRREELQKKLEIDQEAVLRELAAIGFANGTDFVSIEHGCVVIKDTRSVDPAKLPAVAAIKEGANGTEIKLHDKVRALELLGKYLGLFDGSGAAGAQKENNLFEAIATAAEEEIDPDEIPELQPAAEDGPDVVG